MPILGQRTCVVAIRGRAWLRLVDSCYQRHGTCSGVQQPHPDLAVEQVNTSILLAPAAQTPDARSSARWSQSNGVVRPSPLVVPWHRAAEWYRELCIRPGGQRGWLDLVEPSCRKRERCFRSADQTAEEACKGAKHVLVSADGDGQTAARERIILAPGRPITQRELQPDTISMTCQSLVASPALTPGLNISIVMLW